MSLAALEQALWQPAGMAHDGVWHAYQQGKHDVGAHGFNATLEDWGRFGEFVARDGRLSNGKQLVPTGWFDRRQLDQGAKLGLGSASGGYLRLSVVE